MNHLFVLRSSPYCSYQAAEACEAALAFAAFDQTVKVLFCQDGVYQLLSQQAETEQKNIAKLIRAFEIYDIDQVYVSQRDLETRGLENQELMSCAQALAPEQCGSLLKEATHVYSF